MRDFPPSVTTFWADPHAAVSEPPDTRSPIRFLWWIIRQQPAVLLASIGAGLAGQLPLVLGPWIFGRAIDEGVIPGNITVIAAWSMVLLTATLIGAFCGILMHTLVVRGWLIALYGTTEMVTRKVAQLGHVLPRRFPTGETLSVASSDSDEFGAMTEILARATAQLMSFFAVAAIVLVTSPRLGWMVLIAAPILTGVALPFLKPLHRRQQLERSRNSELTSMATDIVAGLRILRGIGGERTFGRNYELQSQSAMRAGVSAGVWQAFIEALGVLFSGVFLVLLTWAGAREVAAGRLSVGDLVALLGYGLFMVTPIRTFFEAAQKITRSLVSARKAIAIFEQDSPWPDQTTDTSRPLDPAGELIDEASGFRARPGALTLLVGGVPEETAAIADRLGRYLPGVTEPVGADSDEPLKGRAARRDRAARAQRRAAQARRDAAHTQGAWGVSLGGVDLAATTLDDVRRCVLVSDSSSQLFAGTLQEGVDPHHRLTRQQAERCLWAAGAEDVYDALPEGWQGQLDERGRGLSGGQRQRVVLARALGIDPPVLVLVEPTSAVDAHTEAAIAQRIPRVRDGRTTIVCSASPLWLHQADHVALVVQGRVVAEGGHDELLVANPTYRAVVTRDENGDGERR